MAKKFFYNKVHNTKKTIINIVIIGVCIIGVIICFIVTANFQGESQNEQGGELSIKNDVTIEVNEKFTNEIFFSKIENVNLNNIKVTYPNDYDVSNIGKYKVTLNINGKDYTSNLNVVDTIKPELALKELTIEENGIYSSNAFVKSCTDNSEKDCDIEFYKEGMDEEGNTIDYSKYKDAGTYPIKIVARDAAGNEAIEETNLIITKKNTTPTEPPQEPEPEVDEPEPTTCKYGNGEYDTDNYLVAINITSNNCAVSLDLYKDATMLNSTNKLMESETTRIKKDIEALNLNGTLALSRVVIAVVNKSGNGIVGYELKMTVTITNNGKTETAAEYKVNNKGKRVFTQNPYNLGE